MVDYAELLTPAECNNVIMHWHETRQRPRGSDGAWHVTLIDLLNEYLNEHGIHVGTYARAAEIAREIEAEYHKATAEAERRVADQFWSDESDKGQD